MEGNENAEGIEKVDEKESARGSGEAIKEEVDGKESSNGDEKKQSDGKGSDGSKEEAPEPSEARESKESKDSAAPEDVQDEEEAEKDTEEEDPPATKTVEHTVSGTKRSKMSSQKQSPGKRAKTDATTN